MRLYHKIDSLPGDIDFQTVITREQAEEKWFGLIHRAVLLTWDLFNKTNIPIVRISINVIFKKQQFLTFVIFRIK